LQLFKRLIAAGGAAGLLVGLSGTMQVFALSSFTATILLDCAVVGQTQKITVTSDPDVVIHTEVTIGGSTANDGTKNGTGLTNANGTFEDSWTIGAVAETTTATVRVWALSAGGVASGDGSFAIHPVGAPCPSPGTGSFYGGAIDTTQRGGSVNKTCDAGVSGNAVFSPTIHVNVVAAPNLSATIVLPANLTLTLGCNGKSRDLPILPVTSVITLHESTPPTGAVAAADTNITITAETVSATINNAKAAVVTTPTPAVIVLPSTGRPASTPNVPWPAFALMGLSALAGAGLVLRRRI
jgi:hypothetical protein